MVFSTISTPHGPNPTRLEEVSQVMRRRGPPTIRVYDAGDHYMALEGCHRVAAAVALGLPVRVKLLAESDLIRHDWDWPGLPSRTTVRRLLCHLGSGQGRRDYRPCAIEEV